MTRAAAIIVGLLTASLLAACGDEALTGPDLRRLLAGNSVRGATADNKTYHVHFTAAGVIYMEVEDGFADQGRWRVTNDAQYCRQWDRIGGGREVCYAVLRQGDSLTFSRDQERLVVSWLDGNPRQLPRLR